MLVFPQGPQSGFVLHVAPESSIYLVQSRLNKYRMPGVGRGYMWLKSKMNWHFLYVKASVTGNVTYFKIPLVLIVSDRIMFPNHRLIILMLQLRLYFSVCLTSFQPRSRQMSCWGVKLPLRWREPLEKKCCSPSDCPICSDVVKLSEPWENQNRPGLLVFIDFKVRFRLCEPKGTIFVVAFKLNINRGWENTEIRQLGIYVKTIQLQLHYSGSFLPLKQKNGN